MLDSLIGFLAGNGGLVKALALAAGAFKIITALMAVNPFVLLAIAVVAIASLIITNWDTIKGFLSGVWTWIKDTVSSLWSWLKDRFAVGLAFLRNLFLNWTGPGLIIKHWDTIKAATTAVKDWIVGKWTAVLDFFKGIPGKISGATAGMWDGIKNAFKAALNWIIDKWNSLSFKLPSISMFGETLGGGTLSTPNIPRLHEGGVFRAPPGRREGLALLEDRETVTAAGQSGTTPIQIIVHVAGSVVSEGQLVDAVYQGLIRKQRRTGNLGLT
jgi:hypothetical protein